MTDQIIAPAATIMLISDSPDGLQALLLRRNPELKFAPNMWVFPGGKVEPDELSAANGDAALAAKTAAVRECMEETNVGVSADNLTPFAHWTTPSIHPKRFATYFYLSVVSMDESITVDGSEIVEFEWVKPSVALERHSQGELAIMAPTFVSLSELLPFATAQEAMEHFAGSALREFNPRPNKLGELYHFLYEGDAGYVNNDPNDQSLLHRCIMKTPEGKSPANGGLLEYHRDESL